MGNEESKGYTNTHTHRSQTDTLLTVIWMLFSQDVALMTAPNDVINQGSKHKGHRREEAILQQQEGLRDMRERIRALEQKWPSSESYNHL